MWFPSGFHAQEMLPSARWGSVVQGGMWASSRALGPVHWSVPSGQCLLHQVSGHRVNAFRR